MSTPSDADDPAAEPEAVPEVRRTNRLAITALVIGLLAVTFLAVGAAVLALDMRESPGPVRDSAGRITKAREVPVTTLRKGDCFTGFTETAPARTVRSMPCTEPHDGEVVDEKQLAAGPYPGEQAVTFQASQACKGWLKKFQTSRVRDDLSAFNTEPERDSWKDGDREVLCTLHYTGPGALGTPLESTLDKSLKEVTGLRPGDCLPDIEGWSAVARTVACTEPHLYEVITLFELPDGPYAGDAPTKRRAAVGCTRLLRAAFKRDRPPVAMSGVAWPPEEWQWDEGTRTAICLARPSKGRLNRSVMPQPAVRT
ncbi:septum formation family protein [Actinomadura fibrosa]|uniref:Septum formation family protein n=1 Tax=Actinomadura fibrosa TaxID=111802 RepID=A0ABW2XLF0_9ACTN|nr:septum formation family protein [Actinomadura fibrosa]